VLRDGPAAAALVDALAPIQGSVRDWLLGSGRVLKNDSHSVVVLLSLAGEERYIKLFVSKSSWQGVMFRFSLSRAVRSCDFARRLRDAGLAVPQAQGCLLVPEGALLITEAVPGDDLKSLWQGDSGRARDWAVIMQRTANTVAALHRAGFAHGDCKWANLVMTDERCVLVDLDGVRKAAWGSRQQAADIARFTLNAEELSLPMKYYDAFVDSYCLCTGGKRSDVTGAALPVLLNLRRRHASKYGHRGHPLLGVN